MSYRPHIGCRACGYASPAGPRGIKSAGPTEHLESILNLGVQPLANAFRKSGEPRPGHYPLELMVCPRCTLGQLSATVDPAVLYANYPYVTSPSQTMRQHFEALWKALKREQKIETVVEIGSNDGLCLDHFRDLGAARVLGIDPADNLVKLAKARKVDTLCSMFDRDSANMAVAAMPPIDLVLARHVFCHIDDWQEFINNVSVLCSKETLVCIEVPYAQDMIDHCQWDTVYAEHTSYLTLRAMKHLLEGSMLKLQRVLRFPVHGGVIGILLRRRDSTAEPNGLLEDSIDEERCELQHWRAFAQKAQDQIANLRTLVRGLRSEGKRVCGYGASAKSTVWISACGFTKQDIAFICDATAAKVYCTSPGTDIPIVHEGDHFTQCMDYVICFCWNFFGELASREKAFKHSGFKWIVPVPEIRIVDA